MNIYREYADKIRTDKKNNVHYWNTIDISVQNCTHRCLDELVHMSVTDVVYDEQDELDMSKLVSEVLVGYLEKHCGAEFPYVDENF